jgi:hypothetical protein
MLLKPTTTTSLGSTEILTGSSSNTTRRPTAGCWRRYLRTKLDLESKWVQSVNIELTFDEALRLPE